MRLEKIDDYAAFLEEAWRQHLAPKAPDAPTVVSLFAGCGGSSLGYSMAGFRELAAVEWDALAAESFRLNFPGVFVYQGDICGLSAESLMGAVGIGEGELDVLDGSPPCQGFSLAGKRRFSDGRNRLFEEYLRLLRGLSPKAFVMENVAGMAMGAMRWHLAECVKRMKASGYRVRCALMDAMWFGVPQSRKRLIFVGVREDLKAEPSHPAPRFGVVRLRDALPSLREGPDGGCDMTEADMPPFSDKYAKMWDIIPVGGEARDIVRCNWGCCAKLDPSKVSPTIRHMQTGQGYVTVAHPTERRAMTTEEAKIIQSFPPAFRLAGGYVERWGQIGNAVPPLMMREVALHVRRLLESAAATREAA
jgi:DNA (cytosine-5)-methyltransferase 1